MFRQLARVLEQQNPKINVFSLHPEVLSRALESAWQARAKDTTANALVEPRLPGGPGGAPGILDWIKWPDELNADITAPSVGAPTVAWATAVPRPKPMWDHLLYAYLVENTHVYQVIRQVVWEYLHGEKLGAPPSNLWPWLRATEELFYRDPPPFRISSITSDIRPDMQGTRRNAYYRMFGMDLNHGDSEGKPYPYHKAQASNRDFVATFEALLRAVHIGIMNAGNQTGPNPTDDNVLLEYCRTLRQMLTTRRVNGNIARSEFVAVAWMSWFHLSVEFENSPVVAALRAEAASPAEQLFKIAERVGVPANSRSDSFFQLAEPASRLMIEIERDAFASVADVRNLYLQGTLQDDMSMLITHWSIATGRDMKAKTVAPVPASPTSNGAGSVSALAPASA